MSCYINLKVLSCLKNKNKECIYHQIKGTPKEEYNEGIIT